MQTWKEVYPGVTETHIDGYTVRLSQSIDVYRRLRYAYQVIKDGRVIKTVTSMKAVREITDAKKQLNLFNA
jgi:hypothetical protein